MTEFEVTWDVPSKTGGLRQATVEKVEGKTSREGDPMAKITFELTGGGKVVDYIMLDGGGKEMGLTKLERLGVARGSAKFTEKSLLGVRISLMCVLEEYNGREALKVDGKANNAPFRLGYGSDAQKPDPDKDVPF